MPLDVVDLRNFYGQALGRVARRFVGRGIRARWQDVHGLRVLGIGYPTPYLGLFRDEAERCLAFMPAAQGVVKWPSDRPALGALMHYDELPLPGTAVGVVCGRSHRRGDQAGVSRGPGPARTAPPRTRARSGAGTLAGRRTGLARRPIRSPHGAKRNAGSPLPDFASLHPGYKAEGNLTRWSSDRRSARAQDPPPRPLRSKLVAAGTPECRHGDRAGAGAGGAAGSDPGARQMRVAPAPGTKAAEAADRWR